MKKINTPLKTRILIGVLNGLSFGLIMAGFDYFTDEPFSIYKFLFHSFFFGLFMTIFSSYKFQKKQ